MSAGDTTQPIILNGRYRLLALVAGGGMARVYKAQDTLLNRVVAIKTLRDQFAKDPVFVNRFREEAQSAANLNHPNIVAVYDVGKDTFNGMERYYIVMEYADGHDLKYVLRERAAMGQSLSIEQAVDIAKQICDGVAVAHKRGFAHCDLKPQNVILTPEGKAKVTDFGIARAFTALPNEKTDTVWGTPQYYAPEQATGAAPTPASDVYSIGVMLYEMLAGRLPFDSKDTKELARMHMTAEPPPLHELNPNVSLQLEGIVRRALTKDASQRFKDAAQFAKVLDAYLEQGDEQTMGRTAPQAAAQPIRTAAKKTVPLQPPFARAPINTGVNQAATGNSVPIQATGATGATSSSLPRKPDALIWVLGALALACVLGLIPLYWNVYRTYSEPPGNITTPTKPASTVAPQSSAATQATSIASITATPTSTAVALQEIPIGLIGRVYDDSLKDFFTKSISWTIVTTDEVNFVQPEKMILAVDPAAGSRVPTTSTITLTLSSGGRVPLSVTFATPIVLESARLNSDKLRAGQTLEVGLNWRASGRVGASYKTFVHVLRLDRDELVAQGDDREPRNNGIPATTSTWSNGTLVNDTFDIALPRDLPAGRYRVQVGLYDDRGRLQVSNSGKTSATNNSVLIRIIEVTR